MRDATLPAREHMITGQLLPNRVSDPRILEAMLSVPREWFVPDALRHAAYVDEDVEVAPGRYLMEPRVFAQMLECAEISPEDEVLHLGCLTGYGAAVLAHLAARVTAVEGQRDLAERARQNLSRLGVRNAEVFTAPPTAGMESAKIYNVIFIEGAVEELPESCAAHLAEGGRLLAVKRVAPWPGQGSGLGRLIRMRKSGGRLREEQLLDVSVPLLPGFEKPETFVF